MIGRLPNRELIVFGLIAALVVGSALIARGLGVHPVQIVSNSMSPTVKGDEWIVVHDLDGRSLAEVERGEIVMLRFPLGTSGRAIKRVIATSGDRVAVGAQSVTVNGKVTRLAGAPSSYAADARVDTVPPRHVFLLGDNSRRSIDSRSFGAVPVRELVARHLVTLGATGTIIVQGIAGALLLVAAMIVASRALRRHGQ